MEYLTLQGSCLLTILIPLNFAIGDGMKWLMEKSKATGIYIVCHLLVGSIVTFILITNSTNNYYIPFIYMGGIVIAMIQNRIIFRKAREDMGKYNDLEIIFKRINVFIGIVIIFLPHIPFVKSFLLDGCEKSVYLLCYFIYLYWGIEKIVFNVKDLYRDRRIDIKI